MKKIIVALLIVASLPALATDSLGSKIIDKFIAAFPQATNVKWYTEGETTAVHYENNGITSNMWYDADGEVVKTRRYYQEKDLAPFLKMKINQKYAGKEIFGVTEIGNRDGLYYVVTLQDAKCWLQVHVDASGDSHVVQKLKKA